MSNTPNLSNSTGNPYEQYKEQSLSTMAPGELLVKLFDELLKMCRMAIDGIRTNDLAQTNDCLTKAQTIVSTLAASLDMRYPVSQNLREMYIFLAKQLLRANMRKSAKVIVQIMPIIKELRDSFAQADKLSRQEQHANAGRAAV